MGETGPSPSRLSIDGIELDRRYQGNGLEGVSQEQLEELADTVFMDMPVRLAIDAMNMITDPSMQPRKEVIPVRTNLPMLLGIFIQATTFRGRV